LERERFGVSHADLGADLLAGWQFDRGLAEALRYHHEAADAMSEAGKLARLAWLTSAIAAGDTARPALENHARHLLQLEADALDAAIARARASVEEKERRLRIRGGEHRLPLTAERTEEVAAADEV